MRKQFKVILLVLLGLIVIIQFIPANLPENEPDLGYNFFNTYAVPGEVETLLRESCFDCHSQEVRYPWYSYIAPVSWLVSRDVRMGRANLDFSRWHDLEKKDKIKMAGELGEEVEIGTMPMSIYIIMHKEADLSTEQRELILTWSEELAEKIFEE